MKRCEDAFYNLFEAPKKDAAQAFQEKICRQALKLRVSFVENSYIDDLYKADLKVVGVGT